MEKLKINYHTGVSEEVEGNLEEAKEIAKKGMSYTQEKVTIETMDGDVLATSYWYGVEPEEDDSVLEQFGSYGFYQTWDDEMGE
ncbi:hypothetical protein [Bacillus pumilus]|uniref:hypothetical protein n=1 Tax=Bacillus pumilus TaxID=1408 RepID=UPI002280F095|nr:hypothetical protein [Bacillus pumilus]MCY7574254.1 hypothetical protein [Bacillus pumilus]MEC3763587.1 hypothetical protein [Bacillus pumilus]MED1528776.1 hypothetical protein [Bacillus pumilus]